MGNLPTYNLNVPGDSKPLEHRNRAVQDLYEPGSTFKIVTLAAALNEGVVNTTTLFDTSPRPFKVPGRPKPITEDKDHNYGTLNVQGILVHSSNIGAAIVGLRMGPDLMLRYARAMGFSPRASASDFFSERLGAVYVPSGGLTSASLAVVSYGYQIVASPLQMVTVMNAFANSGVLVQPRLVRATIDRDVRRVQPLQTGTRVVTAETAATMITMLEAVVEDGTGDRAALARYRVGGKTGTTKQVGKAGYSNTDYLVSFVGIAPTRHPRFSIGVVVERPTKVPPYGGQVSAPIFKRIAEQALQYVGEPPSINAPPAVVVTEQRPGLVRPARPEPPTVFVNDDGVATMPDLTGLTLRDARRLLPGLTMTSHGDGVVVSQSPAAGAPMTTSSAVIKLQRAPVKTGGSGR
jgi:cell division protein FtsI (penicillin-binding protein 3)